MRRHVPEFEELPASFEGNEQNMTVRTEIVPCPDCEKRRARMKAAEGRSPAYEDTRDIPSLAGWLNANMLEGSRFQIGESIWSRLCAPYYTDIGRFLGHDPMDRLMSNLIGSAWGAWRVDRDPFNGHLTIERHKPGNKRTYADPDRRDLYEQVNGELVHRGLLGDARAVAEIARMLSFEHNST